MEIEERLARLEKAVAALQGSATKIKTEQITVGNRLQGQWCAYDTGPCLMMNSTEFGMYQLQMNVTDDGPMFMMMGQSKIRVCISHSDAGPRITLTDSQSRGRVVVGVEDDNPFIAILDESGTPVWVAP